MRKEVVFAILAGGVFGLIVAFGVFRANQALQTNGENTAENPDGPSETLPNDLEIAISTPQDKAVVSQDSVTISGISAPNTWVIISSNSSDSLVITNSQGGFDATLELSGGLNQVTATAVSATGDTTSLSMTLIFSTEFASESEETASESAELNLADKLALAANRPIAYLGTVTDILTDGLQTKDVGDQIQQITINDSTTFADITKTSADKKFEDLAIGDFVAALGYVGSNGVLQAKRVLITTTPTLPNLSVNIGKLEFDEDNTPLLTSSTGTTTLEFTSKSNIYDQGQDKIKLSQVDDGASCIVVSTEVDGELVVRTLFAVAPR